MKFKEKLDIQYIFYFKNILWGILTTFAAMYKTGYVALKCENMNPAWVMLLIALIYFYFKTDKKINNIKYQFFLVTIFSTIFTFFLFFGSLFSINNSFDTICAQKYRHLVLFVGYFCLIFRSIKYLLINYKQIVFFTSTSSKCYFWKTFLFIIMCWSPFLFINFPGNLPLDTAQHLGGYLGYILFSNHHPVLYGILIGKIFNLGIFLGSENLGIFFITICQTIILCGSISYMLLYISKFNVNKLYFYILHLFFGFFYFWPAMANYLIKDVLASAFLLIFYIAYIDLLGFNKNKKKENFFNLLSSGFLSCMLRYNFIYIILPSLIILTIFSCRNIRKKCLGIFLGLLLLINIFNNYLLYLMIPNPENYKEETESMEIYSILLQQTGNYMKKHKSDIKTMEWNTFNQIFDNIHVDELYNPDISDPMKGNTHFYTKENLYDYLNVWLAQGIRHPLSYFEAFVNHTYRYFYFSSTFVNTYYIYTGIMENKASGWDTGEIFHPDVLQENRESLTNYCIFQLNIPFLFILSTSGPYTWILILSMLLMMYYHKWKSLLFMIPLWLVVLTSMAGPFNGNTNYILALMLAFPLNILITFYETLYSDNTKSNIIESL